EHRARPRVAPAARPGRGRDAARVGGLRSGRR
ncbi:MAG: hypothetical protein AVDCRST_MAG30-1268, partial [uncultured Solirubrobacteraceae bacterium]